MTNIHSSESLSEMIRENYQFVKHIQYLFFCSRVQLVLVLLEQKVPMTYLFYSTFENLNHIYDHLFIKKMDRFHYVTDSLNANSFSLLNIHFERIPTHSYEELESLLIENCANDRYSIMFMDNKSLPHRKYGTDYHEYPSFHSITIRKHHEKGFIISDNDPVFLGLISQNNLKTGYYKLPEYARSIHCLAITDQIQVDQDAILFQFRKWIQQFDDDFSFYDKVIHETLHPSILDDQERLWILRQAFTMIAGSRFLFREFLQLTNCDPSILNALEKCTQMAEMTKNFCMKSSVTGVFNTDKFKGYCLKCLELDQTVHQYLKNHGNDLILTDKKELNYELI